MKLLNVFLFFFLFTLLKKVKLIENIQTKDKSMKLKQGFVSNSSSSSFVVTTKPDKDGKVTITLDLAKIGGKIARNEEELREIFLDKYEFDPDEVTKTSEDRQYNKLYNECLEEIQSGRVVVAGYLDNTILGVIDYIGDGKVLEQDGYINT